MQLSTYYSAKSEKGIQARFILKTGGFIDSEFAYKFDINDTRIDLVWVDTKSRKIIFVELKTMGDERLYNGEIVNQFNKYCAFISRYEKEIYDYYNGLFDIKKQLDLLPGNLLNLNSLTDFKVETKPLLLMGDCEQKWIDSNAPNINKTISQVAIGAYYFGKPEYNCDLIQKKSRNRYVF